MRFKARFTSHRGLLELPANNLRYPGGSSHWLRLPLKLEEQQWVESVILECEESRIQPGQTTIVICTTYEEGELHEYIKVGSRLFLWEGQPSADLEVLDVLEQKACWGDMTLE